VIGDDHVERRERSAALLGRPVLQVHQAAAVLRAERLVDVLGDVHDRCADAELRHDDQPHAVGRHERSEVAGAGAARQSRVAPCGVVVGGAEPVRQARPSDGVGFGTLVSPDFWVR
jgi:hypothetical protein